MYDKTITLFNRYDSRLGDTWYPTVLHGVDLNIDKASIIAKYGPESSDRAALHIRYEKKDGMIYVANKQWLPPKQWDGQTNDKLVDSVTFTDGNKFDFFYWGEWDEVPIADNDYSPDGFYSYMNAKKDFVFAISSIGGPYTLIPHFEILGK